MKVDLGVMDEKGGFIKWKKVYEKAIESQRYSIILHSYDNICIKINFLLKYANVILMCVCVCVYVCTVLSSSIMCVTWLQAQWIGWNNVK